jgi:hypothetical protein
VFAQSVFAGLSGVGISVPVGNGLSASGTLYGIQAGSYDLFGPNFGLRANAELGAGAIRGLNQAAVDAIYTSGGGSKLVLGAGAGAVSALGFTNAYVEMLIGGDFVIASSPVSFFIEGQGRYYPSTSGYLFPAHLGFNFHF